MQDSKRKISAKKQLKQDLRGFDASSEKKGFFGDLSSRMEQIKNMENEQKREYKNIDDDEIIPLTLASQYIPIRDIKGGIIETTDNRFLKIVELEPVNYNLKSESEKKRIINAFEGYLKIAPKKMQIKCMCHEATVNDIVQKINNNKVSEQYDNVRDIYEDSIRFVRSLAATDAITKRFFIVFQYEPEAKYLEKSFEHAKKYLYDVVETATKYLKVCGNLIYDTEEHPNHNQARYIYEILNRKKAFTMPFEYSVSLLENRWMEKNGPESVSLIKHRDYVSPDSINFENSDFVVVDGVYYSFMFIRSDGYPAEVYDGWTEILTTLGEGVDIDWFIERKDGKVMADKIYNTAKINQIRLNDKNDGEKETENLMNLSTSVEAARYLRSGILGGQQFFYVNTMITVTAYSQETLEYKLKKVKEFLTTKEIILFKATHKQEDAYYSYMPFNSLEKNLFKNTKQNILRSGLISFFPFTSDAFVAKDGILFGTSEDGFLVSLDNFNSHIYKNANMSILGTSGAGKTYTLQTIAKRYRENHIPVCIIAPDKEEEFARMCKKLNGSFISMSPSSDKCINIMEIRPRDTMMSSFIDGNLIESSWLIEKVQSLLTFFTLLVPDITKEEKQLLDQVILRTYNDFGITDVNSSIYDSYGGVKTMPILGDLHLRIEQIPELKKIATSLLGLVSGSARNFNQQTNVDLENEYTVIGLSKLTGDMLLVGMFIALDFVVSKAKEDRTQKKAIIADELWLLLGSNELAANYCLTLFKTIRAYSGAAIGATQDISDFYALENGKYGKGIINNSKIKLVLQLEHEEAESVKQILNLTDEEALRIESFEKGQAMLIANQNNMVVNVKASKLEHYHITTDRNDLQKIADRERQGIVDYNL